MGSTSGVIVWKISMTPLETSAYFPWLGGMIVARGQSLRALLIGIAEWTPWALAS